MWTFGFFITSIFMGVALAIDAFSVSAANALNEPDMSKRKMFAMAGVFCGFQIIMPVIGWLCVVTIADIFGYFRRFIPWIALVLLLYIGGKMLIEGIRGSKSGDSSGSFAAGVKEILIQGVATSIDALSVGFTISELAAVQALTEAAIIGLVTFAICIAGIFIGKKFGTVLSGKASIVGGSILIIIGIEIFVKAILEEGTPVWLIK